MALLVGGWTMDRLEIRQIHAASIPGLVPILLGILLALCALLLLLSTFGKTRDDSELILSGGSWAKLIVTGPICTGYAVGLVGTISYTLATAIFTFVFALIFSFPGNGSQGSQAASVVAALVLALCVAFGSALLFRDLFLVRLP